MLVSRRLMPAVLANSTGDGIKSAHLPDIRRTNTDYTPFYSDSGRGTLY